MTGSKVLQENMLEVNKQLIKVSGIGITVLYGLSFALLYYGYLDLPIADVSLAAASSYCIYLITLLLYRFQGLRQYFHFIFPFELYITVAIGIYFFQVPISAFPIWLIPIIYAGMYAHLGSMIATTLLVLITGPLEVLYLAQGDWSNLVTDVAIASIVMIVLSLRMISLVNRSRVIIAKTEQEVDKNSALQQKNQILMTEVAATTAELGEVVEQLTLMAKGTRDALLQIAKGGEEMITASHDSQQVLHENYLAVEEQATNTRQIGLATQKAVMHTQQIMTEASLGEEVVEKIASIIKKINTHANDTMEKVGRLTERTADITSINQSIAAIAKNVTIVAINASIEAARAGAAGRTFQVVAGQVQELAHQTADAVESIGKLAAHIQDDLLLINQNLQANEVEINGGVAVSGEATDKLHVIGTSVADIHQLLIDIHHQAELQQQAAGKIAEGIGTLRVKTEQNVSHIEMTAASTEETTAIVEEYVKYVEKMRERAQKLRQLISEYHA